MSSSFIRTPTAAATSASPVLRKVTSFLSRVSRVGAERISGNAHLAPPSSRTRKGPGGRPCIPCFGVHTGRDEGEELGQVWHGQVRSARSAGSLHPGFSSPCTFVAAASGANGTILWERPAAQNGALVECTGPQPRGGEAPAACILLGRPGPFIAVNLVTGRLRPEVGALGLCTRSDARMLRGGSTRGSGSKTRQEERLGVGGDSMRSHPS